MATPLSISDTSKAVKQHYKDFRIKDLTYKSNPFYALIPKYEKFGGLNMPIPLIYGNPQNVSATFSDAQDGTTSASLEQFVVTRVKNYSVAAISGEAIKATEGNANAFIRYLTLQIDGAIQALSRDLAIQMFGSSTGVMATVGSAVGPTVTLANVDDITRFEVGMKLLFATNTAGSAGLKTLNVLGVDRNLGTLTVDASTAADGDFIIRFGTETGAGSPKALSGLDGWLPAGTPADLFGVVRTTDRQRLAGIEYDGSAEPIEEALLAAAGKAAKAGGRPDTCFLNFESYINLEKSLGSRVRYTTAKARDVDIGFNALSVQGPNAEIRILPDQNCPSDVAYMLQMDTWTLNSLGGAPHILDLDGNRVLRQASEDAYEVRIGFYGNMACNAPGWNVRVAL